ALGILCEALDHCEHPSSVCGMYNKPKTREKMFATIIKKTKKKKMSLYAVCVHQVQYELTVNNNNPTTSGFRKHVPSPGDRAYFKPFARQIIAPLFQAAAQFIVAQKVRFREITTTTESQLLQSPNFVFDLSSKQSQQIQVQVQEQHQSQSVQAQGDDTIQTRLLSVHSNRGLVQTIRDYNSILLERWDSWMTVHCLVILFFGIAELLVFWVAYNPYQFIAKRSPILSDSSSSSVSTQGLAMFIAIAMSHLLCVALSIALAWLHITNLLSHMRTFFDWARKLATLDNKIKANSPQHRAYLDFDRHCFLRCLEELCSDFLTVRFIQTRFESPIADVINLYLFGHVFQSDFWTDQCPTRTIQSWKPITLEYNNELPCRYVLCAQIEFQNYVILILFVLSLFKTYI
ncbi:hypothetical protein RFI_27173, partial [Reticulomyxa filosa]